MNFDFLTVYEDGGILAVTINCAEKLNAPNEACFPRHAEREDAPAAVLPGRRDVAFQSVAICARSMVPRKSNVALARARCDPYVSVAAGRGLQRARHRRRHCAGAGVRQTCSACAQTSRARW